MIHSLASNLILTIVCLQGVQERMTLLQSDVLALPRPEHQLFDVIAGNNYSHFTFKTEDKMEQYLGIVFRSLQDEGILVLDCYGGPEAHGTSVEEVASYDVPIPGEEENASFDYVYEQATYDPNTKHQTVKVHFKFEDGSWIRDAFTYDWRVWDINELRAWCHTQPDIFTSPMCASDECTFACS